MRKYKSHQEMGGREGVSGLIVEIGEGAYKLIVECLLQVTRQGWGKVGNIKLVTFIYELRLNTPIVEHLTIMKLWS